MKRPLINAAAFTLAGLVSWDSPPRAAGLRTETPPAAFEGYLAGAGGVRLFYRVVGAGPHTIVVVHGGPEGGMNTIAPNLEALSMRHRVIYYDQRGVGRSDLPRDTTLLDARFSVEDLDAVRRHFGLGRLTLLAHSFGALIAARYALTYPDHLQRMLFLKPSGARRASAAAQVMSSYENRGATAAKRIHELIGALQAGAAPDAVAACRELEQLLGFGRASAWRGTTCDERPEAVRYAYQYTSRITVESFGDWDFTSSLSHIFTPLLIVSGNRDQASMPLLREWALALPNARLLIVTNSSDGVPVEQPDVFFPAVDTFIAGHWPKGAVKGAP